MDAEKRRAKPNLVAARLIALFAVASVTASEATRPENPETMMVRCIVDASTKYSIPPLLVLAVKYVESGNAWGPITNENTNGSVDMGVMQINDWWHPHLRKHGFNPEWLATDQCMNIYAGTWILAQEVHAHGVLWGVARYNSPNRQAGLKYAERVFDEWHRLEKEAQ